MEIENARQSGIGKRQSNGPEILTADCRPPDADSRVVQLARAWIGTPYVHQASLKGVGCDCLGLLRGIWRELKGCEPEAVPPYSPDWAEATGTETLYMALARHAREVPKTQLSPGDIALFRMNPRGPAKHCGIVASGTTSPVVGRSANEESRVGGGGDVASAPHPKFSRDAREFRPPHSGGGAFLALIHARANKRVSEEPFSPFWRAKLAFAFRL